MENNPQYLTAESFNNLQKELEVLKIKTIPEIANHINEAKQQGDLSENAEYHHAKEEMAWAQGRSLELEQILQNATIITPKIGGKTVTLGSEIIIKIGSGAEKSYIIVGAQEANPLKGIISNESPLGGALLGHEKGDKFKIKVPSGEQVCEILDIK